MTIDNTAFPPKIGLSLADHAGADPAAGTDASASTIANPVVPTPANNVPGASTPPDSRHSENSGTGSKSGCDDAPATMQQMLGKAGALAPTRSPPTYISRAAEARAEMVLEWWLTSPGWRMFSISIESRCNSSNKQIIAKAVGEMHSLGVEVVHVEPLAIDQSGRYWGFYWQHPAPFSWEIEASGLRGSRDGTVRPDVRAWFRANVRKGASRTGWRWRMESDGRHRVKVAKVTVIWFRNQTDASMFRLRWL